MKKIDFNEVKQIFINNGYTLLETEYISNRIKMRYCCPKHADKELSITLSHLKEGKGCPYCANRGTVTIEDAKKLFEKSGYKLLENNYTNNHTKMRYCCPEHTDKELSITYNNLQSGYGCPYCANNVKLTLEYVKEQFAKEGYELLDDVYVRNDKPLKIKCPRTNEINVMTYHDFQQSRGCGCCRYDRISEKTRLPYDEVKKTFDDAGYELISPTYKNARDITEYKCPKHSDIIQTKTFASFRKGSRCPLCYNDANKGVTSNAWKGGVTEVNAFLRTSADLTIWKIKWLETTNGRCSILNIRRKGKIQVHHSKSHYIIRDEVLVELGLPLYEQIGDYTEEQRNQILTKYIEKHETIEGIPMHKNVHKLFHQIYGISTTPEDFEDFKLRFQNNEFCDII